MKSFILFALVSLPALACPNLAGKYLVCKSTTGQSSGSRDVVVTQKVTNGVTSYVISSTNEDTHENETQTYIADGKARSTIVKDPQSGLTFINSNIATCQGTAALNLNVSSSVNGQVLAQSNIKVTKSGGIVKQEIAGIFDGQRFQDTVLCQ